MDLSVGWLQLRARSASLKGAMVMGFGLDEVPGIGEQIWKHRAVCTFDAMSTTEWISFVRLSISMDLHARV